MLLGHDKLEKHLLASPKGESFFTVISSSEKKVLAKPLLHATWPIS